MSLESFIHRIILYLLKYTFAIIKPKYARFFVQCLSFLIGSVDKSWLYTDNNNRGTWIGKNIQTDKEDRIIHSDIIILWIPGGGFRVNLGKLYYSTFVHWISQMEAQNIKCTILVANYRLSPENKYPAATEDIARIHDWLLNTMDITAEKVIWGADDAGASIALDTLYKKLDKLPKPSGLILSSPYIGMDPGGKSWRDNYGVDIINEKSVEMMEHIYTNQKIPTYDSDDDDDDYNQNSIDDEPFSYLDKSVDLQKYIPSKILIEVGEQEVLLDDTELLTKILRGSGHTNVVSVQNPDQKHLWTLLGPKFVTNINQWERTLDLWSSFVKVASKAST